MKLQIACVVVTFNRKELLAECLSAIDRQTFKPHTVFIVDNASTDGTQSLISEKGFKDSIVHGVHFQYILLPTNQGGAGGFYTGMKAAHDAEIFDAVWVMDDDGLPDAHCLENLVKHLGAHHYIAPLVLDRENPKKLAFNFSGSFDLASIEDNSINGLFQGYSCPFNGILYSMPLIDKVGFPKKEMFIWGDEMNYGLRCEEVGVLPITVINAVHYHPKDRFQLYKSILGTVTYTPLPWKAYCQYRNSLYNNLAFKKHRMSKVNFLLHIINNVFYLVFKKFDLKMLNIFFRATSDAMNNRWNGHWKYFE